MILSVNEVYRGGKEKETYEFNFPLCLNDSGCLKEVKK